MNPLLDIIRGQNHTGYYEFRWPLTPEEREAEPKRRMNQRWVSTRTSEIPDDLATIAETRDLYVGAAPRTRRAGDLSAIQNVWCLWVDIDAQKNQGKLADFPHPPSLIIGSGTPSNVHAYWRLQQPLPADWASHALRRLAHHLDADPAAKDPPRVMRPPGSWNHKTDPPLPVTVLDQREVSYLSSTLVADLPDPRQQHPRVSRPPRPQSLDGDLEALGVEEYYGGLTGWDPSGSHVRCPFWDHRSNPAMVLYPATGTWHCFACSDGGDVYQFGARLYEMDRRTQFPELRRRLLDELGVKA